MSANVTVAKYVQLRLEQVGVDRIFGVAGNYTAPLLDTILACEEPKIAVSQNTTELTAGFAADAYARYKPACAVYVTYGVGALTALNAIAGSFTELVPVVLINGSPTTKENTAQENDGVISLHSTGSKVADIEVYRPVTAAAVRITNASQAPYQIDSVLTEMLTKSQPVYLEVQEDVWRAKCICSPLQIKLQSGLGKIITVSNVSDAVTATLDMIGQRSKLMFWVGVELQRFGLQSRLEALLKAANTSQSEQFVGYATSLDSKSILSENNPFYIGTYKFTADEIVSLVGDDGTFIALGSWTTSANVGGSSPRGDGRIYVGDGYASIGDKFYASVDLAEYMEQLEVELVKLSLEGIRTTSSSLSFRTLFKSSNQEIGISYDDFLSAISQWLTGDDILIVDAGLALNGSKNIHIPAQNGFLAQANWLSIGYSVPAATGVKCANEDKRAIVVTGDGAFHENFQAISDQTVLKQNNVIFVLVNGLYGIEQYIVNPNPFRKPPAVYDENLFNKPFPYNKIAKWDYTKIPEVFGSGIGLKVSNRSELQSCLTTIRTKGDYNFIVEVTVPPDDTPSAVSLSKTNAGEDEIPNKYWPPADVF